MASDRKDRITALLEAALVVCREDTTCDLITTALGELRVLTVDAQPVTVTPTVQSDGYEFEVPAEAETRLRVSAPVTPACNHQHQKLVGNSLRCANCDTELQVTGVVGKTIGKNDTEWSRAASEGGPDAGN